MPIISTNLGPATPITEDTKKLTAELHLELTKLGFSIATNEINDRLFGSTTSAAIDQFRQSYGFPSGQILEPLYGQLSLIASLAIDSSHAALRTQLQSINPASIPEQACIRLARFSLLAMDYPMAKSFVDHVPAATNLGVLRQILTDLQTPIQVAHPEILYTYRYQPFGNATDTIIQELKGQITSESLSRVMLRRRDDTNLTSGETDPLPPVDPPPPPPPPPQLSQIIGDPARKQKVQRAAANAIYALEQWQIGNAEFTMRRFKAATEAYSACEQLARYYFDQRFGLLISGSRGFRPVVGFNTAPDFGIFLRTPLNARHLILTLAELKQFDWETPPLAVDQATAVIKFELDGKEINPDNTSAEANAFRESREHCWDRILFLLVTVFVPLARAEANRMVNQHAAAISDLKRVLSTYRMTYPGNDVLVVTDGGGGTGGGGGVAANNPTRTRDVSPLCDFIERPFARLLLAETLIEQAEVEYKSRIPVTAAQHDELKARQSYLDAINAFASEGAYVERVRNASASLATAIGEQLAPGTNTSSIAFRSLGKGIDVPTIVPSQGTLPGLGRNRAPHQSMIRFTSQEPIRETNPKVYSLLLFAQSRLEQIAANFNYLGYRDDYTPPWRFGFLLERTRYFAEHAKSAQRDYLNFLNNAENEEFKELSASQNVEMERSSVRIEEARVDQVGLEVKSAKESQTLAVQTQIDAVDRLKEYLEFDDAVDELFDIQGSNFLNDVVNRAKQFTTLGLLDILGDLGVPGAGTAASAVSSVLDSVGDFFTGGAVSNKKQNILADRQRELEKSNLARAMLEANQASKVADANLEVAKAGLIVASLQRQSALLRHEFALQNLFFLRNRILNAEQWYRLAASIRGVADTYLRYAIELGFLTEQAYEFEADKQFNVMRFDYDLSEIGNFLAADFLLRDLDTLEQDLIVTQRERQQQVRYVLSMAREFPEALQELRDRGSVTFSVVLEQIERRFPGLFNARLGAVDVLPVALLDSTRFSLELTHLGSGFVRSRAQPGVPPPVLPTTMSPEERDLETEWPRQVRVNGPETGVFSGLSRQEASAVFGFMSNGQRNAFEGRPAASAWRVDMSMRENQVIPGSLVDLLFTFTVSGYHDANLRSMQERLPVRSNVLTRWVSARQTFPDAFYEFKRSGKMVWKMDSSLLTLTDQVGALRNVGMLLLPAVQRVNFAAMFSRLQVRFKLENGAITLRSLVPAVRFELLPDFTLRASTEGVAGVTHAWDFGDGQGFSEGDSLERLYRKPGTYTVTLRVVQDGRLTDFKSNVAVSRSHAFVSPMTVLPVLGLNAGKVTVNASATVGKVFARIGDQTGSEFQLADGEHTLDFVAARTLRFRAYCDQRHHNTVVLDPGGLNLASNRRFDDTGQNVTGVNPNPPANDWTKQLFGTDARGVLSPEDNWTLELNLNDNPDLVGVTLPDVAQLDLSELQDVVLAFEYETMQT